MTSTINSTQTRSSLYKSIDEVAISHNPVNFQHRLVYQVIEETKIVKIIRMWSHYE